MEDGDAMERSEGRYGKEAVNESQEICVYVCMFV